MSTRALRTMVSRQLSTPLTNWSGNKVRRATSKVATPSTTLRGTRNVISCSPLPRSVIDSTSIAMGFGLRLPATGVPGANSVSRSC